MIFELNPPIKVGDETHDRLELREFTYGEYLKARKDSKGDNDAMVGNLLATVSGTNRMVIEKLPMSVFMAASEYISGFLSPRQSTSDE